jgi:hypothetical protein
VTGNAPRLLPFFALTSALMQPGNPFAVRSSLVGWLTEAVLWASAAWVLTRLSNLKSPSALQE